MTRRWLVKVKLDKSEETNVIVKAATEHKAKEKAVSHCYNVGYHHVEALSCKEI